MPAGVVVGEFADQFPKINRGGGISGPRRTDVDVALEQLQKEFEQNGSTTPSRAMRVIDYTKDAQGEDVEVEKARQTASSRVQALRSRGYTKDAGWRLAAIDGNLWAQFYGPGNHPVSKGAKDAAAATV